MKKIFIFLVGFAMLTSFAVAQDSVVASDDTPVAVEAEVPAIVGTWRLSKYEWTIQADGTGIDQDGNALTWTPAKKGYVIKLKKGKVAARKIEDGKMVTNIGIFTKQ